MSNHIALRPPLSREKLDEAQLANCERVPRFLEEAIGPARPEDQPAFRASA
jgi:hypothetical protein